jgi:hypothetical protein
LRGDGGECEKDCRETLHGATLRELNCFNTSFVAEDAAAVRNVSKGKRGRFVADPLIAKDKSAMNGAQT